VMASFFATGVVAQLTGGRLGDRIGHRPVLLAGLIGYAVASCGFLLDVDGWGYLVLRSAQGAAAGAAQVACLALVARTIAPDLRGRAYGVISGAELGGVAVGPLLGTAVGIAHMGSLFVVAAAAAALAAIPVFAVRISGPRSSAEGDPGAGPRTPARLPRSGSPGRALAGVLVVAGVGGVLAGLYEACWSLLMHARGATEADVGLSWTLFALPFAIVAPLAGWVADRRDRRVLVLLGLALGAGFAGLYPFLPSVEWLIGLGAAESLCFVFAVPAAQSLLTEQVPSAIAGRAQGAFVAVQTSAIALSATVCGAAFAVVDWLPFVGAMVTALAFLLPVLWLWRDLPGRVRALDRVGGSSSSLPQ